DFRRLSPGHGRGGRALSDDGARDREDARRGRQDGRHAGDDRADVRRGAVGGAGRGGTEGEQAERERRAWRHRGRPDAPRDPEEERRGRSKSERAHEGDVEHDGNPEGRHRRGGRGRRRASGVQREQVGREGEETAGGSHPAYPALPALPAMFSIRAHSTSDTGITESREILTSANVLKNESALISFSVTGRGSFFTGPASTRATLPVGSFGSAYASPSAMATPTTDFSSPVW